MKGPFVPRQKNGEEWVPIPVGFEGWPPLPPPLVVENTRELLCSPTSCMETGFARCVSRDGRVFRRAGLDS